MSTDEKIRQEQSCNRIASIDDGNCSLFLFFQRLAPPPPSAPAAVLQRRAVKGPGAPSFSSEEEPPGRCVPGATLLEWPLESPSLIGFLSPSRRTPLASSVAREKRRLGGGAGAAAAEAELPAPLPKTSPNAVAGAGSRNPRPALDGAVPASTSSCAGVGDGSDGGDVGRPLEEVEGRTRRVLALLTVFFFFSSLVLRRSPELTFALVGRNKC
jgi:hypothetical protein